MIDPCHTENAYMLVFYCYTNVNTSQTSTTINEIFKQQTTRKKRSD